MGDVPEQQNALLDIPNKVDQAVLEKFGQKTDDAILAEEKDTPLSPRSLLTWKDPSTSLVE